MQRHILQHRQTKLLAQWDDIKVGGGLSITRLEMGRQSKPTTNDTEHIRLATLTFSMGKG
jgi:hypothetical protein